MLTDSRIGGSLKRILELTNSIAIKSELGWIGRPFSCTVGLFPVSLTCGRREEDVSQYFNIIETP